MEELERLAARVEEAAGAFLGALGRAPRDLVTPPDPETGEQWDLAHVVGHVAEMLGFWAAEVAKVAARGEGTPFGRVKASPERIARIEERASRPLEILVADVERRAGLLADLVRAISPERMAYRGSHPTRGPMSAAAIVAEFGVDHLEEHARQLSEVDGR
jgi:hypothetical protein